MKAVNHSRVYCRLFKPVPQSAEKSNIENEKLGPSLTSSPALLSNLLDLPREAWCMMLWRLCGDWALMYWRLTGLHQH